MYSCFIQIPSATVKSLAQRPIRLEENDFEDGDIDETVSIVVFSSCMRFSRCILSMLVQTCVSMLVQTCDLSPYLCSGDSRC